jgi:hypothetical protein
MSYSFAEGSKFYFSSTFAAAKTVTAATNANPAVLTSTAHGYTTADEFLLMSGWADADNSVFKANVLTTDTLNPLGLNTTSSTLFTPSGGAGTMQKISSWLEIPQVLSVSSSGGDAKFVDVNPLGSRNGIKFPTGFNPMGITLELGHDPNGTNFAAMLDISRTFTKVAFKQVAGGGAITYGYGYMIVGEAPSIAVGSPNKVSCAINFLGRTISY